MNKMKSRKPGFRFWPLCCRFCSLISFRTCRLKPLLLRFLVLWVGFWVSAWRMSPNKSAPPWGRPQAVRESPRNPGRLAPLYCALVILGASTCYLAGIVTGGILVFLLDTESEKTLTSQPSLQQSRMGRSRRLARNRRYEVEVVTWQLRRKS